MNNCESIQNSNKKSHQVPHDESTKTCASSFKKVSRSFLQILDSLFTQSEAEKRLEEEKQKLRALNRYIF
ncbi:MAG: hypothetical protein COT73_11155 [Bdellovibrio sp. CG10_big_fil_rev_8_21_14_0_10_47_8]|nr:MAG: hypothetical protein COT73_11155 [Bdellovibrio sp. CG10_big_fil_rev_8_21_14_0_10_47_8]